MTNLAMSIEIEFGNLMCVCSIHKWYLCLIYTPEKDANN